MCSRAVVMACAEITEASSVGTATTASAAATPGFFAWKVYLHKKMGCPATALNKKELPTERGIASDMPILLKTSPCAHA